MPVTRRLARFLLQTAGSDLPEQAREHAKMVIASTLASAACGLAIVSTAIIRDLALARGGRGEASLWFTGAPPLPAADAAQVNAVASDAAASDDSDLRNIVHAGTPLTATALALAERTGADGAAVLRAIVLGYEVAGRISEAITPGFRTRGFHGCLGAVFAATTAAGLLLRLDETQLTHAIALSATSIGGLATAADTSVSREYHAGVAVQSGINAALAAQRGLLGEPRVLESPKGFFEAFGGVDGASAAAIATQGLGESWDIVTDMAIKLMPGGHPFHALAEAGANAARAGDIRPDEVDSITISRLGLTVLTEALHPHDLIGMAHSPAYFVAAGVADRAMSWQHASQAKIDDPVIHRLIDRVRIGPPPTDDAARYRQGATVTIRTLDGREVRDTVYVPKGAGQLGIDWADVAAKYRTLVPASGLAADRIEASLAMIRGFEAVAEPAALLRLIRV
jgi:2-methylcitrate dehydratase PrpD